MAKIVLTEDDGRTRTFTEGGTPPPSGDNVIRKNRGAYKPTPPRILVHAGPGGTIVAPRVWQTQEDPKKFDEHNGQSKEVWNKENTFGVDSKGFALDFAPGGGPVPEGYDAYDAGPHLSSCYGFVVTSGAGQQCVGSITIPGED